MERGLDALDARIMVVDRAMRVVYTNAAAVQMFSRAEPAIRRVNSGFRAVSLTGSSLRTIAPELVRRLTAGELATGVAVLVPLGGCAFRISAQRIDDANGGQIGSALEWEDVTEEIELDRAIADALREVLADRNGWNSSSDRLGLRAAFRGLMAHSRAAGEVLELLAGTARRRAARAMMN